MRSVVLEVARPKRPTSSVVEDLRSRKIIVNPAAEGFFTNLSATPNSRPVIKSVRELGYTRQAQRQAAYNRAEKIGLMLGLAGDMLALLLERSDLLQLGHKYHFPLKHSYHEGKKEFIPTISVIGTLQNRRLHVDRTLSEPYISIGPSTELILFEAE